MANFVNYVTLLDDFQCDETVDRKLFTTKFNAHWFFVRIYEDIKIWTLLWIWNPFRYETRHNEGIDRKVCDGTSAASVDSSGLL